MSLLERSLMKSTKKANFYFKKELLISTICPCLSTLREAKAVGWLLIDRRRLKEKEHKASEGKPDPDQMAQQL